MYIFSNAIKNIFRNKGRNILMAVILFAIILTTAVSIIINTTTKAIIEDYKTRFGSEVTLTYNEEKMPSNMNDFKEPTTQQKLSFGESSLLQKKEYSGSTMILPKNLKALDENEADSSGGMTFDSSVGGDGSDAVAINSPKGRLLASLPNDEDEEFKNGLRKITQGKLFENPNECLVSEEFAKLNNLKVGDKITVTGVEKKNPKEQELTISGIYADNTSAAPGMEGIKSTFLNRGNEILVSFDSMLGMELFKQTGYVDAKFYLKDPSMLAQFNQELHEKGLPEYYKAVTDEVGYKKVVGPVEGLAKITNTFTAVVLVLGSLILILLSILAIRERKYEIGVLRAMGMKKGKVALGLLSEMIVITAACLVVGLGAGAVGAQPVADVLLENQIQNIEETQTNAIEFTQQISISGSTSSQLTPLSELKIALNKNAIGQIALIAFGLAIVSSAAGILFITKYEPIRILSERN